MFSEVLITTLRDVINGVVEQTSGCITRDAFSLGKEN